MTLDQLNTSVVDQIIKKKKMSNKDKDQLLTLLKKQYGNKPVTFDDVYKVMDSNGI